MLERWPDCGERRRGAEAGDVREQPALKVITVEELKTELAHLTQRKMPHVLIQSRRFVAGDGSSDLLDKLLAARPEVLIVNADASARNPFENDFLPCLQAVDGTEIKYRYSNQRWSRVPAVGPLVGRNHVRFIIAGETAYFSTLDLDEPALKREELILRITDPEMVQMMKAVALSSDRLPQGRWEQKVGEYTLILDTGRDKAGYVSRWAEEHLLKSASPGSEIWVVSSWYPDELLGGLKKTVAEKEASLRILVNSPYDLEKRALPFNLTKVISQQIFHKGMGGLPYEVFFPQEGQFHGRLVLVTHPGNGLDAEETSQWLVGTSNFTVFGSKAGTTELALAGEDQELAAQLRSYIKGIIEDGQRK